ncbi:MAG: ATP-binding protein [Ktedonobacterales bacterium]
MQTLSETAAATLTQEPRGRILLVDGDQSTARTIAAILRYDGHDLTIAATAADALRLLQCERFDLLLADAQCEQGEGGLIAGARALVPEVEVLVMARASAVEVALQALQAGAFGYVIKPVDVAELRVSVARGLEHRRLEHELEAARDEMRELDARTQREIDDATADLRDRVAELDAANQRLQDKQIQHDRFVAMVAHELRGPLNPIINYAQIAKRPSITPQTRDHYLDVIVEHAFRLNRLVDDLQTATRLSTGHFTLKREPCDLGAALEELMESFRAIVRDHQFTFELPPTPLLAEVDRDRVVQAVRNLVDNAVKYSADQTAVELRLWADENDVFISVRDFGMGIPESEMQRIFEAFIRLGKSTEISGSGLGLFITRGIAEMHGGRLSVESGVGSERARGAVFTLALPRSASPAPEAEI